MLKRRRAMMSQAEQQTVSDAPLYPLKNGTHTFDDGSYVTVTNGNHVFIHGPNLMGYYNITDVAGHQDKVNNVLNINNKPLWFTVPAGVEAVLSVTNIDRHGTSGQIALNFRRANAATSGSFTTGNFSSSNDVTVTKTLGTDEAEGCLFVYATPSVTAEFDVTFTVGGIRWI